MITEGLRHFNIPDAKPAFAEWPVPIDISEFLDGGTISDVDWSAAIDDDDKTDATEDVLDEAKCDYDETSIIPFIKAGTAGTDYIVTCEVTTSGGSKDVWYVRFSVI